MRASNRMVKAAASPALAVRKFSAWDLITEFVSSSNKIMARQQNANRRKETRRSWEYSQMSEPTVRNISATVKEKPKQTQTGRRNEPYAGSEAIVCCASTKANAI